VLDASGGIVGLVVVARVVMARCTVDTHPHLTTHVDSYNALARALQGSPTEPGKEAAGQDTFVVGSTTDVNDDRSDRAYNAETPNPKCRR
jgi:hypothetical protein